MLKLSKFSLIIVLIYFFTFLAAGFMWPGSNYSYLVFSASFTALLIFALKSRLTAGYVFFVVALWIGYWLKLSIHIIEPKLTWMEPIGLFDFSSTAWDKVAIISSIGAIGVLLAGCIQFQFQKKILIKVDMDRTPVNLTNKLWLAGMTAVLATVFLNEFFNIVHASIPPVYIGLPFHLQGLFGWCVGGGIFLILMIPFHLSIIHGHFLKATIVLIIASVLIGVSIFSRGTVVFQSIIVLGSFFVYSDFLPKINTRQVIIFVIAMTIGIILSVVISQTRREVFFASIQPTSIQPTSLQPTFSKYSLFLILKLPIERWVGLEGVMAISAHKEKSNQLLLHAIKERRVIGALDMYTHDIALSASKDTKTVMYATPPGVISFWYYSGSLTTVFLAATLLTLLMMNIEYLLLNTSNNPFLSSAVGIGIALQFIHMGTGGLLIPAVITFTTLIFALIIGSLSKVYIEKRF